MNKRILKKEENLENFDLLENDQNSHHSLLNSIYQCYYRIIIDHPNFNGLYLMSIIIKFINFFALLIHKNFKFLWDFSYFNTFRKYLNYLSFENYLI